MGMEKPQINKPYSLKIKAVHIGVAVLGLISGIVYLFNFKLSGFVPLFFTKTGIHLFSYLFVFLSIFYLLAVCLVFKYRSQVGHSNTLIILIILFAIIFRASLLPLDPEVLSKDMYRYIWDARIQQEGINPYLYPPSADELKPLRDDQVFPNINRRDYPTIYPAGAQLFFRIFYLVAGNSIRGFKGFMVFFDVLTLLMLAALLKTYGLEEARLIAYAWNPLAVFEIAYSGHLEGLTVFLIVTACYLNAHEKKLLAIVALALASSTKLYPALLLPAFVNRGERIKGVATFSLTFMIIYLPFFSVGNKLLGFLPHYFSNPNESFNLGIKYLIMRLFPGLDYFFLTQLFGIAILAAGLIVFFKKKNDVQVIRYAYLLVGLLIILMPASLHPWYVIWLLPFLVFYPAAGWLVFSCAVSLSYLKYVSPQGIMPTWVLVVEYLPLFALLATGYIFKKYIPHNVFSGFFYPQKTEKLAKVTK
jgi:hypothetical protein